MESLVCKETGKPKSLENKKSESSYRSLQVYYLSFLLSVSAAVIFTSL